MILSNYKTLVFDCDGVVLDSNKVKTSAFYRAALPFGEEAAIALVDYHVRNGGISRYRKFEHFLTEIVDVENYETAYSELLDQYANEVANGLLTCSVAPGLLELRKATADSKWLIVSGGDQNELRDVFARRDLIQHFDAGIFGSPKTKDEILSSKVKNGDICFPALFLGDSMYDHQASTGAGLDFVFVSDWSEVANWQDYCAANGIETVSNLADLSL